MQYIKDLVYSISIINLLDIAIITSLIYAVITWFKDTRAFQILATVIGMGIVYFAASKSGLILTSILFQYLWAAIIIVLGHRVPAGNSRDARPGLSRTGISAAVKIMKSNPIS